MLRKLVKHDILSTYRDFAGLYMGMFAFAILAAVSINMDLRLYLIGISIFLLTGLSIATAVVTFVSIIRLFGRRMFTSEGYLTLTLPVTNTQTVLAKLLTGAFWSVMTSLMFMVVAAILAGSVWLSVADRMLIEGYTWSQLWAMFLETGFMRILGSGILLSIPLGIMEMFYSLLILLFVIVFVNTSFVKKSKTGIGIVVFLVINVILNTFRSNFIAGPVSANELNIQILPGMNSVAQVLAALRGFEYEINWLQYAGMTVFYIVVLAGFGYLTVWLLNKKLELE
ncbi:MAG: hypothetical protein Q8N92_01655 [Erysipelotrichaceae bacterium]|nr:hypothetical protein [Erysipelotrichaceae bacterium]